MYETIVYNTRLMLQYTAYSGRSYDKASDYSDVARQAIAVTRGAGEVVIRLNHRMIAKWTVADGLATCETFEPAPKPAEVGA